MKCKKVKLKKGYAWECYEEAPVNPRTGKRRQIRRRGKTQREAKDKVEEAINAIKNEGVDIILGKRTTFGSVAKKWLRVYEVSGVVRNTIKAREYDIEKLNEQFSETPIVNITHYMYQNFLINLHENGYAETTMDSINNCANMIFNYAVRNKIIKENPRKGAVIPKKQVTLEDVEKQSVDQKYFGEEEMRVFFNAIDLHGRDLDKEVFYTLAFTGMRSGELCALKKSDLDFEKNTIKISKTLTSETNNMRKYALGPTKTKKSRIVVVEEKIMDMLKDLIRKNNLRKMKYRLHDDYHDADFVFQRYNGYPLVAINIRERMKRLLKKTEITKKLTPHSFRHTHISMLTEAGVDLATIMERVGHEDPNTTLKIYTHVTNEMKEQSVKKITDYHDKLLKNTLF